MRLWDVQTGAVRDILAHRGAVSDLAVNVSATRVASVGADGFMRLWEPGDWTCIARQPTSDILRRCALSADGNTVVCGGHAGRLDSYSVRGAGRWVAPFVATR
jgi:WD40 repeat protein